MASIAPASDAAELERVTERRAERRVPSRPAPETSGSRSCVYQNGRTTSSRNAAPG